MKKTILASVLVASALMSQFAFAGPKTQTSDAKAKAACAKMCGKACDGTKCKAGKKCAMCKAAMDCKKMCGKVCDGTKCEKGKDCKACAAKMKAKSTK